MQVLTLERRFDCANTCQLWSLKTFWARPGFEPGTSRTLSENHTPRPTSRHTHGSKCKPFRFWDCRKKCLCLNVVKYQYGYVIKPLPITSSQRRQNDTQTNFTQKQSIVKQFTRDAYQSQGHICPCTYPGTHLSLQAGTFVSFSICCPTMVSNI